YSKEEWRIASVNNWLLKDISGQLISDKQWPENYAADIGNPDYQKWVANKIKEWLDRNRFFDGVFADCGLSAYVDEWQWGYTNKPINPRTGTDWKDEEVKQAHISLHKEIKKAIGSKLLTCNGIFHGERFYSHFDDYKEVISNSPLDGVMSEGMWQTLSSEQAWLESLKFLSWMEDDFLKKNANRYFIPVINKILSKDIDRKQLVLYGVASTLLGVKTNQIYIGGMEKKLESLPFIRKLRSANIGKPINDYYVVTGTRIYTRDFTNGKVIVNPTLKNYNISLDRDYYTLDGKVVSELTMESHTGDILLIKSH
ncbi:MAG: putative glycoside hydrolase, partial [Candidatus Omnitrophota bacterium]